MNQTGEKASNPAIMKRKKGQRARFHDYCAPGYYLITSTCEEGDYSLRLLSRMPDVSAERLRDREMIISIFTALGEKVRIEIESINTYHPKIEVIRYVIMPDHIHLVIFVKERLDRKLGSELAGFFGACTRHFRNINNIDNPDISLFEPFHDRIIFDYEQLDRAIRYVQDNPRRLIIKRMYPHLFKRFLHVRIDGREYGAMGNIFLLHEIYLLPVRIHRRWSPQQFDAYETECSRAISEGAVVISPGIHKRERDILNIAIEAGGKVIKLIDQAINARFKPSGRLFDLSAEGRLLLLAPWQEEGGKRHSGYTEFHNMNDMAASIAEMPADTRMSILSDLY